MDRKHKGDLRENSVKKPQSATVTRSFLSSYLFYLFSCENVGLKYVHCMMTEFIYRQSLYMYLYYNP